jgi:hypothetical protein
MSSFSAGAITGTLALDTSQFEEATRESASLAGEFGVELGRVLAEATGSPILGELANGFSEIAASLGEGNWTEAFAAGIHTAGAAVSGFVEIVKHQGEAMHQMGLEAERAGVSVEWFSSFSKAAADAGVNVDELGATMKFLQRNATDAVEGNKEMIEHFQQLGLSVDYLRSHLDDTQGLFTATIQGLGGLGSDALKTTEAMNILGRGGSSLKPIFDDGGAATMKLAEQIRSMGGAFTEEDAKLGDSFSQLSTLFTAMIDGMEKAAATPILQYLTAHSKELTTAMMDLAHWAGTEIPIALDKTINGLQEILDKADLIDGKVTTNSGGTPAGDAAKQWFREQAGSLTADLFFKITGSEDISWSRLANDVFAPNDDGVYADSVDVNGNPRVRAIPVPHQPHAASTQTQTPPVHVQATVNVQTGREAAAQIAKQLAPHVHKGQEKLQKQLQDTARVAGVVK